MTRAMLPIAAVLVLGLGVYLFVEVRAEPAPPEPVMGRASRPSAPPVRTPQVAPADEPVAAPHVSPPPPPPPQQAAPRAAPATPTLVVSDEPPPVGAKLDAAMAEANRAYDRGDFDEAKAAAGRLLAIDPSNVRMLRVMVSASCLDGDATVAQTHYARLPPGDQEQMKLRCARYGITFPDKP